MATEKKKEVKMKDLKPAKDAKGGVARQANSQHGVANRGGGRSADSNRGSANSGGGRNLL